MAKLYITTRELSVLELASEGFTNYEIGEKLFMSKRTAEGIRQHLIFRTGVRNTAALITFAFRAGIIR